MLDDLKRLKMAEITKCREQDCPKKETCLRWIEPAGHSCRYFIFDPRNEEGYCPKYIEVKENKTKDILKGRLSVL